MNADLKRFDGVQDADGRIFAPAGGIDLDELGGVAVLVFVLVFETDDGKAASWRYVIPLSTCRRVWKRIAEVPE